MDRRYIISILLLVVIVILAYMFVYPLYKEVSDNQITYDNNAVEYNEKLLLVTDIKKIENRYNTAKQELSKISTFLPIITEKITPEFYTEFGKFLASNGFIPSSLSFTLPSDNSGSAREARVIKGGISGSVTYQDLKRIINAFVENAHLMDIVSFSLSGANEADTSKDDDVQLVTPTEENLINTTFAEELDIMMPPIISNKLKIKSEPTFSVDFSVNIYYQ